MEKEEQQGGQVVNTYSVQQLSWAANSAANFNEKKFGWHLQSQFGACNLWLF